MGELVKYLVLIKVISLDKHLESSSSKFKTQVVISELVTKVKQPMYFRECSQIFELLKMF